MKISQLEKDLEEAEATIEGLKLALYEIGGIAMSTLENVTLGPAHRTAFVSIKKIVDEATSAISEEGE